MQLYWILPSYPKFRSAHMPIWQNIDSVAMCMKDLLKVPTTQWPSEWKFEHSIHMAIVPPHVTVFHVTVITYYCYNADKFLYFHSKRLSRWFITELQKF